MSPGLFAMSMDTEESLKEYLRLQLKIPLVARLGPLARTFDFVANAAPGVKEILTVGKFLWEVREQSYDLVVVDAVATGHITGQLAAPQAIQELVQVGLVRDQTGWMLDILGDPEQTGAVIVAAPEEMPVNETLELVERLATETVVDLAAVVANRVLPELFARGEEEVFDRLTQPGNESAAQRGPGRVGAADPGGGPARGDAAPHPGRAPGPAARRAARGHATALRPVPLPAQPRRPGHPTGGRAPPRGAGVLTWRPDAGRRPRRVRSSSCSRPRRS